MSKIRKSQIEPFTSGGGVNQVSSLPVPDSSNYGEIYLKSLPGVKDSLWLSMLDATGTNQMANIALGSYAIFFDPLTDVAGCQLWVASDLITGLSDGDPVTTWTDQSPNALSFVPGSFTAPDYVAVGYNGLPTVRNTGGLKALIASAVPSGITSSSNSTSFFVMKHNAVSGDYYQPFCIGTNIGSNGFVPYIHYPDLNFQASGHSTGTWSGEAPSSTDIKQYTVTDNSGIVDYRINSTDHSTRSIAVISTPTSNCVLFSTDSGGASEIDLCEVLIYAGVLSSTDRDKVEAYLQSKWGLI